MDKFIYETKPYILGLIACYALLHGKGSVLMTVSGLFMALASVSIGMLRYDSRSTQVAYQNKGKPIRREEQGDFVGHKRYYID